MAGQRGLLSDCNEVVTGQSRGYQASLPLQGDPCHLPEATISCDASPVPETCGHLAASFYSTSAWHTKEEKTSIFLHPIRPFSDCSNHICCIRTCHAAPEQSLPSGVARLLSHHSALKLLEASHKIHLMRVPCESRAPEECPAWVAQLIKDCMHEDPMQRPTSRGRLSHAAGQHSLQHSSCSPSHNGIRQFEKSVSTERSLLRDHLLSCHPVTRSKHLKPGQEIIWQLQRIMGLPRSYPRKFHRFPRLVGICRLVWSPVYASQWLHTFWSRGLKALIALWMRGSCFATDATPWLPGCMNNISLTVEAGFDWCC